MTSVRKFLALLAVFTLAAVALPATAASGNNKIYNLFVHGNLLSIPAGTNGTTDTIEFDNISPDGNSTFKSLKLFAPPGITVTAAQVTPGSGFTASVTIRDAAGNIVPAGTAIWVDVINLPVKPFGPNFFLTVTVNAACAGGGPWTATSGGKDTVYTGTGWTGQTFSQNNLSPASAYSTTITGACTYSYSISGVPGSVTAGTSAAPQNVIVANAAASAASIDAGFKLKAPSGITVAIANVVPAGGASASGDTITITNAIAPGGSVKFDLTLTSTTPSCTTPAGGGAWTLTYTPAQFTGNTPSTTINASSCTLSFTSQPNNALSGQKITNKSFDPTGPDVTVQASINGSGSAASGVSVSLVGTTSPSSPDCSISGATVTTDANGVADFSSLKSNAASTVTGCSLTATATNYTQSAASNAFEINFGASGVLGCSSGNNTGGTLGSVVVSQSGFFGKADWGIVRGNNWAGDLNCTLVPYVFNLDTTNNVASFTVDNGIKLNQDISAEYVVLFQPVPWPTATGQWPNFQAKLAWSNQYYGGNGVFAISGTTTPLYPSSDYVPALACIDDDVNGTTVLPTIPADAVGSGGYTDAYNAGNGQYKPGLKALMCIVNHGWTVFTLQASDPNPWGLTVGQTYIQAWYKVMDRGDGYTHF